MMFDLSMQVPESTLQPLVPDPWLLPASAQNSQPFSPYFFPLDPTHELPEATPPTALLAPPGNPDLLKLPAPTVPLYLSES